jgi:hypothetical protein
MGADQMFVCKSLPRNTLLVRIRQYSRAMDSLGEVNHKT